MKKEIKIGDKVDVGYTADRNDPPKRGRVIEMLSCDVLIKFNYPPVLGSKETCYWVPSGYVYHTNIQKIRESSLKRILGLKQS